MGIENMHFIDFFMFGFFMCVSILKKNCQYLLYRYFNLRNTYSKTLLDLHIFT